MIKIHNQTIVFTFVVYNIYALFDKMKCNGKERGTRKDRVFWSSGRQEITLFKKNGTYVTEVPL